MKKFLIIIASIFLFCVMIASYITLSTFCFDNNSYRKIAWENVKHDKTVLNWKTADVSLTKFKGAYAKEGFFLSLNRSLLFLNGGNVVKVVIKTTADPLLGPHVLYFNPITKQCVGYNLRM